MRQFDVFPNTGGDNAAEIPYVVQIQNDLLDTLPTCMVIPLVEPDALGGAPMLHLNPLLNINGRRLVLFTQEMAPVPRRMLKSPIANLSEQRDEILAATDFLFTGF